LAVTVQSWVTTSTVRRNTREIGIVRKNT